ncbi:MAG: transaldolase [Gemmatirosa sp.]
MAPRLKELHAAGQSVWLDYIDRAMLHDGDLERRIREDALTGMTSNPTIFEKALAEGAHYDLQLAAADAGLSAWELFELVETEDVRRACDLFLPVYEATERKDGYVSIEVSPGVAEDPDATIEEGRRLWATVARPNVMIKVPGTEAGARAVRTLLSEGINVNVTLLFSVEAHRRVIEAYLDALEQRAAAGQPIDHVASVASFFVSRVDSEIDKRLDVIVAQLPEERRAYVASLKGRAAVANAKLAYRLFQQLFSGPRWDALAAKGAMVQRPLWASTSVKNPAYRDVLYVEQLIGPDTVNTLPPATLEAFRDHGETARTVDRDLDDAERVLADLEALGISIRDVTDKLLVEGIASFQKSFDGLLGGLERKLSALAAR